MAFIIQREKDKPKKSTEQEILELKAELQAKNDEILDLKEQMELVQGAVDEIIFGGML